MGIGNWVQDGVGRKLHSELITPHGDRELRDQAGCSHHVLSSLITPHGDREHGRTREHEGGQRLITPHGDRERRYSPYPVTSSRTHYPSWGSGTQLTARLDTKRKSSLPLMGIGNPGLGRPPTSELWSHYPSWGSGTRTSDRFRGGFPAHYPSWGSGTSATNNPNGRWTISLPLMGIGNVRRAQATFP